MQTFNERYPLGPVIKAALDIKPPLESIKASSIFTNKAYYDKEVLIAEIAHHEDFPILFIYTADPVLKAKAQANLMAKYMVDFYIHFVQFLPLAARAKTNLWTTDPIPFINQEISRRQLDFSYVEHDLHYMLIEFNLAVDDYNQSKTLSLHHFTIDDLKSMLAFCDVYKGIGCSAAVRQERTDNDQIIYRLIRNLDWLSLDTLGSHTMGLMTRTPHQTDDKPHYIFSVTLTPGIMGLSMANDKGLVITLNEATKMNNKRENPSKNCIPQFVLIKQIIENCSTISDVKHYLETHQPATSHILTVLDAKGGMGIFEMLPNLGPYNQQLYRFRGHEAEELSLSKISKYHVSNHFLDENGKGIVGSHGFDDSFIRFYNMGQALRDNKKPDEVAKSSNVHDTVQTLIFTADGVGLSMKINWANSYSATAVDSLHQQIHYTEINLTQKFQDFSKQIKGQVATDDNLIVHEKLIELMTLSHKVGAENPQLTHELNQLYSELTLNINNPKFEIIKIIDVHMAIVETICLKNLNTQIKMQALEKYKQDLSILYDFPSTSQKLFVTLGSIIGGAILLSMIAQASEAKLSLDLLTSATNILLAAFNSSENTNIALASGSVLGMIGANSISNYVYNIPKLSFFSSSVARSLENIVQTKEKDEEQIDYNYVEQGIFY